MRIPSSAVRFNRSLSRRQIELLSIPWVSLARARVNCAGVKNDGRTCTQDASFRYEGAAYGVYLCGFHLDQGPEMTRLHENENRLVEEFLDPHKSAWRKYKEILREMLSND